MLNIYQIAFNLKEFIFIFKLVLGSFTYIFVCKMRNDGSSSKPITSICTGSSGKKNILSLEFSSNSKPLV